MPDQIDARFAVALVLATLVATVAAVPPTAEAGAGARDAALDRGLEKLVDAPGGPPGTVATVRRRGKSKLHTAGVADVESGDRIRAGDRMRIASVAKAFSGAVALTLVSRGKLSLNDTIGARLPSPPAAWADVTIAQLLNHTAGLPDYIRSPGFIADFSQDPRRFFSPRSLIDYVADEPLSFAPGTRYEYSDSDNIAIGLIVEAVTGRSYERNLEEIVFTPLNLPRTSLPSGFEIPSPFIHGFDLEPGKPPEDVSTVLSASGAWASGGIISTPRDLNRFIRAYAGGRLFGRRTRASQLRFIPGESQPPGPGENSAGLGIFRYRTGCGTVFGHTGSIPGYTQFVGASRNGRRSATVSVNAQLTPTSGSPEAFGALRRAGKLAVCAALAG